MRSKHMDCDALNNLKALHVASKVLSYFDASIVQISSIQFNSIQFIDHEK